MSGPEERDLGPSAASHAPGAGAQAVGAGGVVAMPGQAEAEDMRFDGLLPLGNSPLVPRGSGRPLGAKNRRTDLVASYLVERFGDPLTASMSIAGRPVKDLVRELREIASDCGLKLGASVMDIVKWQQEVRRDVLPYIHAKRAPETAKGDVVTPVIGIGRVDVHVHGSAAGRSIEDMIDVTPGSEESEQDQGLNETDAAVSHDDLSQGGAK